ncbi:MAG: cation:proton antiporter [Candidatus Micrarchaeia archaeon]
MIAISDFGVIVIVATIAGAIAIMLRQPSVIGLLVAGMIVGPHQLGLVGSVESISSFADVGAILLLFAIGLEFSMDSLKSLGAKAAILAATKMGIIMLLGYLSAVLFGLKPITGMYLGAILSITSTAIVSKILTEKNFSNRPEVPLLIASLIVEDIISIFILAVLSGLGGAGEQVSLKFILSVANSLVIFGVFYLVLSRILKIVLDWLSENRAEETLAFSALSMGVGLSFLAQFAGLPASIGAFLAGNLISSLKKAEEFKQAIYPLIFVFSALFFLSVGMVVDLASIMSNIWLVVGIAALAVVIKFVATHISYYFVEADSRSATFAGIAMLSIGEFSILIAQLSHGIVTEIDLVGITSALVLVTSLLTSIMIDDSDYIWRKLRRILPARVVDIGRQIASQNQQTFHAVQYNYSFNNRIGSSVAFLRENILLMVIIFGIMLYSTQSAQTFVFGDTTITLRGLGLGVALVATAAIMIRTIIAMRKTDTYTAHSAGLLSMYRKLGRTFVTSAIIWVAVALIVVLAMFESNPDVSKMITLIAILAVVADIYRRRGGKPGMLPIRPKYY